MAFFARYSSKFLADDGWGYLKIGCTLKTDSPVTLIDCSPLIPDFRVWTLTEKSVVTKL